MPGCLLNYERGTPPNAKKILPNQIYFICVWWLFSVIICLIAKSFELRLCSPSHTKLKPPLPNSLIFSYPYGNLSPNTLYSSSVRSYWLAIIVWDGYYLFFLTVTTVSVFSCGRSFLSARLSKLILFLSKSSKSSLCNEAISTLRLFEYDREFLLLLQVMSLTLTKYLLLYVFRA
jgi:hypothetical protein